jgi:hypothetical protein
MTCEYSPWLYGLESWCSFRLVGRIPREPPLGPRRGVLDGVARFDGASQGDGDDAAGSRQGIRNPA